VVKRSPLPGESCRQVKVGGDRIHGHVIDRGDTLIAEGSCCGPPSAPRTATGRRGSRGGAEAGQGGAVALDGTTKGGDGSGPTGGILG